MIRRLSFIAGRTVSAAIFIATWVYGVTTYSPFAFDMFVSPRLLPGLTAFVDWHHAFFWTAWLASSATLVRELRGEHGLPARIAAATYVLVFFSIGCYLLWMPYLVLLTTNSRPLAVVPGALLPPAWLAVIDHLGTRHGAADPDAAHEATSQGALLTSCLAAGAVLWSTHLITAIVAGHLGASLAGAVSLSGVALLMDMAALAVVFTILSSVSAAASAARRADAWEARLTAVIIAIAVTEWWRRSVLPAFAFPATDAALIAAGLGAAVALMWSGVAARRTARGTARGLAAFIAPGHWGIGSVLVLLATPLVAAAAFGTLAPIDWAGILKSSVVIVETIAVLGALLAWRSARYDSTWSIARAVVPLLAAVTTLAAIPYVIAAAPQLAGRPAVDFEEALDRVETADPLAGFASERLFARPPFDIDYFRDVLASETRPSTLRPVVPPRTLAVSAANPAAVAGPDVYVFVVDSLRRDYLSPYNQKVTFTPAIGQWAAESHVFRNAFTRYGGTWLSMPSIWTGSVVTRGWTRIFSQMNALEGLIISAGFDWVINDFTVAPLLKPTATRTFLDPDIPSADTDLCRNLQSLEQRLAARRSQTPPLFAYLAPMNVHLMNTHARSQEGAGTYPGFYSPYGSRLQRIDSCFGAFITFLKTRQLYDNSLIILTSDHGDDLGEGGRWGHQFYLYPEIIRIPLIIHLPQALAKQVTTDLGRLTLSTDLMPTLAALLGRTPPADLGPLFGSRLYVPTTDEPAPRRRDDVLVMSSYGSTYGLLRRNGRSLYISDMLDWREYALSLLGAPDGATLRIDSATRSVSQDRIRKRLAEVDRLYSQR